MPRRTFDAASTSDGDSDRTGLGVSNSKRMLYTTPKSKPMGTPGSRRVPRTGGRTPGGTARIFRVADPVGVYCRLRPWGNGEGDHCFKKLDDMSLVVTPPPNSQVWKSGVAKEQTYGFQHVYGPETCQQKVFDDVAMPLVQDVLKGKNALLFAYGVTGSGKTYTMSGTNAETGVMPRCLDVIFNSISQYQARKYVFKPDKLNGFDAQTVAEAMLDKQKEIFTLTKTPKGKGPTGRLAALQPATSDIDLSSRKKETRSFNVCSEDMRYSVFVTYIEIYNNFVYDLLDDTCFDERTKKFNFQNKFLREDGSHNVYVNGCTEIECSSAEEAIGVFLRGQKRRKQAHTALNTNSSRSHAIFNVRLVQAPLDNQGEEVLDEKDKITISQFSLVDLAGSERYGRTNATGDRLKEAGKINSSLMTLRLCMDILRENQQEGGCKPVPFRDSKITHYLKNYFEGEGRVRMIICLNPRNDDYDENLHVMAFAKLTQEVQIVRPSEKRLDPLTPGRRKANEIFKEARRRIIDDIKIDENVIPVDINAVYGLGGCLPSGLMTKSDEEGLIESLRVALEQRINSRSELGKLILQKRQKLRAQMLEVERSIEYYRQENTTLKCKVDQLNAAKTRGDLDLTTLQTEKCQQDLRCEKLEAENRRLKEELETCKMEARQKQVTHLKDKERIKADLGVQLEQLERDAEKVIKKKERELRQSYKAKDKTFEAIRNLVEQSEKEPSPRKSRTRHRSISGNDEAEPQQKTSRVDILATPQKSRYNSTAIINPRYRVANADGWLEHVPKPQVPLGTIFSAAMNKKKSVTKLTEVNDLQKTSKYCLNVQEADSDGLVETRLYKADVMPSPCGGAQVVFHDIEILKQVSPSSPTKSPRKRNSNGHAVSDSSEESSGPQARRISGSALHLRCASGVGHIAAKKRRTRR